VVGSAPVPPLPGREASSVAGNGSAELRSVVSKVAAILGAFRFEGALTVTEIARSTELPLSTAHRLVVELADWQLLRRGGDGRYGLTGVATRQADRASVDIRDRAEPVVEDLSSVMRRDVRLGVLDGLRVRYAEKTVGRRPLSNLSATATSPARATAIGQVLLTFTTGDMSRRRVGPELRSYTSSTWTTATWLKQVRLHGVAVVSGEHVGGQSAVAAPVFRDGGEIVAALGIRLHDVRAELPMVVPALMVAARGLSRDLAHRPPAGAGEPACPVAMVVPLEKQAAGVQRGL
jgi:DNA-binding IclR family transcriptional regulator